MNTLKSLLPSIIPLLVLIAVGLSSPVQSWVGAHPLAAAALGALGQVINHWLPSPAK